MAQLGGFPPSTKIAVVLRLRLPARGALTYRVGRTVGWLLGRRDGAPVAMDCTRRVDGFSRSGDAACGAVVLVVVVAATLPAPSRRSATLALDVLGRSGVNSRAGGTVFPS